MEHRLGRAAHEFFDERGGDAVGAFDDEFGDDVRKFEAARVEAREFSAAFGVGQREFDGLVNAAGASGEGGFELSGRLVVRTKKTAASSRRPSISLSSLLRRLSSQGLRMSPRSRAMRSTSSMTTMEG